MVILWPRNVCSTQRDTPKRKIAVYQHHEPRQQAVIANDHAVETLHKACLAGLDAVLHHIVVETTGQKQQQQPLDGTSMLESIRCSLDRLENNNNNSPTQLPSILKRADHLLLDNRCLLTTGTHAHLGRTLVQVLCRLGRSADHPSFSTALDFAQVRHILLTAIGETAEMLDQTTHALRHILVHEQGDEEPPAYHISNDHAAALVDDTKPPEYDDELDSIMNALFRLSTQYNNQRVDLPHTPSLTDLLAKSFHRPRFSYQRFMLSNAKERDLFMIGLFHKVNRVQRCRLSNQDADLPRDDLDTLLHRIAYPKRSRLDNQRAAFSCPSST